MDIFTRFYIPRELVSVRFLITGLFLLMASVASAQISGTVFRDFDSNGIRDVTVNVELGVPGVVVTAYRANNTVITSATTNSSGSYTLASGIEQARLEFTGLKTSDFSSFRGTNNGTAVQFVTGPITNVNFGVNYPRNYCGVTNPALLIPCYVNGNPLSNTATATSAGNRDILVSVPYNSSGASPPTGEVMVARGREIGAVFGMAVLRQSNRLFSAAFMKRHVGFGPSGPGAIYVTNLTTNTSQLFTTLNAGTDPHTTLTSDPTAANRDPQSFTAVGKVGLGGLDLSDDGRTMYVVNLFDRKLYTIPINTPATPTAGTSTTVAIPSPCGTGSYRPFAVKYYRGEVYIGVVCSDESATADLTVPNATLQAVVYAYNGSTFRTVLTVPLNYLKGPTNDQRAELSRWYAWGNDFYQAPYGVPGKPGGNPSYPQPWLTDLEFDVDGTMIVALRDRFGDQAGDNNFGTSSTDATLYRSIANGDLLRAGPCGANGTFVLESNGIVCSQGSTVLTTTTGSAAEGPGGREFYFDNVFCCHNESSFGGVALLAGRNEVVNTTLDPLVTYSAGLRFFNNTTGGQNRSTATGNSGVEIYRSADASTFGKANGLGDVELDCNPAPIEIGNRVWRDLNANGRQDANETGVAGVTVQLYLAGTLVSTTTTSGTGEFYFNSSNVTGGLQQLTAYEIRVPLASTALSGSVLSPANSTSATDGIDSDAIQSGVTGIISVTTGIFGENNHSLDIGISPGTPNLGVTKTAANGTVNRNANNVYQVVVTNTGSATATNVVVTDILGAGQTFVGSTPAPTTTSGSTRTYSLGSLAINASATISVTVTATNEGVLANSVSVTATENESGTLAQNNTANATFAIPVYLCAGESFTATLPASFSNVQWFQNGTLVASGNSFTITQAGTYSYSASNLTCTAGCTLSALNGAQQPLNITPSSPAICPGLSTGLTVSGCTNGTLLWSTGQTAASITVSPVSTTAYSVTCTPTSTSLCPSTTTVTVTVNPTATATLTNATICTGGSAVLTATGGISYRLLNTGATNSSGQFTVSPTSATVYTVVVTNVTGCTASATSTVTVNPLPTPTLNSVVICAGQTASLSATGGTSYTLLNTNTVNTTGAFSVTPAGTTSYTVRVSNANGCTATATGTVTVNPLPTPTLSNTVICAGQTATITATGGTSYTLLNTNTVNTTGSFSVAPTGTTSYTVRASNANGCTATATNTLTVNALPTPTINNPVICAGQSAILTVTGGISYQFVGITTNTSGQLVVSPSTSTTYSVIVANASGCTALATSIVTVNPVPVISITPSNPVVCLGSSVTLTTNNCTGTLRWSTNEITASITVFAPPPLLPIVWFVPRPKIARRPPNPL